MADHNINWGRAAVSMGTTRLQTLRHKSTLPSQNKKGTHSAQNDVKGIKLYGLKQSDERSIPLGA